MSDIERRSKRRSDTRGGSSSQPQPDTQPTQPPQPSSPPHDDFSGFASLFDHDLEQVHEFIAKFATREIIDPKYTDPVYLSKHFHICSVLDGVGLSQFCQLHCSYYETLVRAFYKSLRYDDGILHSRVKGVDIRIDSADWLTLIGYSFDAAEYEAQEQTVIPYDGEHFQEFTDYDREVFVDSILRPLTPARYRTRISVKRLNLEARLLHYVVTHIILPRHSNYSVVLENDIFAMWAIRNQIPIDWRHTFCRRMMDAHHNTSLQLPYCVLVQKMLELKGVSMVGHRVKKLTAAHTCIREALLKKIDFRLVDGVWQWDDELTYGIDFTAPTAEDIADPPRTTPAVTPAVTPRTTPATTPGQPSSQASAAPVRPSLPLPLSGRGYTSRDIMEYLHRQELQTFEMRADLTARLTRLEESVATISTAMAGTTAAAPRDDTDPLATDDADGSDDGSDSGEESVPSATSAHSTEHTDTGVVAPIRRG